MIKSILRDLIWIVVLAVVTFCTASTCSKNEDAPSVAPLLTLSTPQVDAKAGSQFISVQASGRWTLVMLKDGETWAKLSRTSGTDSREDIVLEYAANEGSEPRTLTIALKVGGRESTATLTQKGKQVGNEGGDNGGNGDGKDDGGDDNVRPTPSSDWMEMPELAEDSDLSLITHRMKINGKDTRNYTILYDEDNLVSWWVAYPLSTWNIGSAVRRTDNWGFDPVVPAGNQPTLFRGFGGNGYDRGHQIPSADRLASYEANSATFYFTNMTPQLGKGLNQDIWADLENAVRSYANRSDTLYVVTGCDVRDVQKYVRDNDGKDVAVPTAYYKALLRMSSAGGKTTYTSCAYYFEHKNYSGDSYKNYKLSVSELESKVGVKFFANLPAKVGAEAAATIKSANPKTDNFWN